LGNPGPSLPTRAKNIFLLGLNWHVGEWGSDKRDKEIDERYDTMMIAGNTVAKISSENGESEAEWRSGWTEWGDIFLQQKFGQWRQFFFWPVPRCPTSPRLTVFNLVCPQVAKSGQGRKSAGWWVFWRGLGENLAEGGWSALDVGFTGTITPCVYTLLWI
jgi:hypothetical protein